MFLGDQSAPVTWQRVSGIPHGGIVAFCSSAVCLFLQTPTMLKTLALINKVAEHGLFSCTFKFINYILRYTVDHHPYVASCFKHQFGGLSSLECATCGQCIQRLAIRQALMRQSISLRRCNSPGYAV